MAFPCVNPRLFSRFQAPAWERISAKLCFAALVFCLLTVILSGCQTSEPDPESSSDPPPSANRPLCVIASGDTHGWIIPCGCTSNQSGGLLRRGTYVAEKQQEANVIAVDVGGAADGTAAYQKERFRAILKGQAQMPYVAHNLGAAEIAFGADTLQELSADTGVTFISANTSADGKPIAASHIVSDSFGLKLLIVGVVSPDFATGGIAVTEPTAAVLSVLDQVAGNYDRLIVLAYLPVDQLRSLAESLPEADIVIGGPTGQALTPEKVGRTLVTSATNKGKFLAEVTFTSPERPPAAVVVEMSDSIADHVKQKANLAAFRSFLEERDFKAHESGFADNSSLTAGSQHSIAGTESCADCHDETNTHWATTGHSHAWQRLVDEGAHVDPYCQQCHTTGYGLDKGFLSAKLTLSRTQVGCESCHGPSSAHVADSSVRTPFDAAGTCLKCHDPENSPHFEYDSYWKKVQHE